MTVAFALERGSAHLLMSGLLASLGPHYDKPVYQTLGFSGSAQTVDAPAILGYIAFHVATWELSKIRAQVGENL